MIRVRLSATVEADLLEAGRTAVAEGRADNVSAWVNQALQRQVDHDRGLQALGDFLDRYEAEHGEITDEEIRQATLRTRSRATSVRPLPPPIDSGGRRAGGLTR